MAPHATAENGAAAACAIDSVARVYESDDELVVLVRLTDDLGLLELRTPRRTVTRRERGGAGPQLGARPSALSAQ